MEQATISECRTLKTLLGDDWRPYAEAVRDGETDISYPDGCTEHRMIRADVIDEVMREELLSDKYVLGGCTSWFVAAHTPFDIDTVERLQKNEEFEALGELLAQDIDAVQEEMVGLDGYGHHFNGWDGSEEEIEIDGSNWYVFVTN